MHQSRRRQPGLGLMLLFYQIFGVIGIDRIPPVTLGIVGLQVAVFLRLFKLPWYRASEICVSAYNVWKRKEYMRLIYAAFEHGDDWHLYYNMVSFALKGQSLERRFGSIKFLYIISVFTVLTNAILVALNMFTSEFLKYRNFESHCAIGFSGVIFALKVLTTHYDSNYTHQIMGIPILVPARYAVWVELILIQLFIPNVSFFGHLAGILTGMAYVKGPLKSLMDLVYYLVTNIISPAPSRPQFPPRAEPSGFRREQFTEFVPPGMSEEEQIQRAMEASIYETTNTRVQAPYPSFDSNSFSAPPPPPPGFSDLPNVVASAPPPPGFIPDLEELRNRRQAHFTDTN